MIRRLLERIARRLGLLRDCDCHTCRTERALRSGPVPCAMCQRPASGHLSGVPLCTDCVPATFLEGGQG